MSPVIVFSTRKDFRTLVEVACKSVNGFPPVVKDSIEDLESILGLVPEVHILIIDGPENKYESITVHKSILANKDKVKKVLYLGSEETSFPCQKFSRENAGALIDHLKNELVPSTAAQTDYISVPIETLVHFKLIPFDLFVKLGDNKYLKRVHANDEIDAQLMINLKAKGITELAFEKRYNKDFSLMLLNNMINKVEFDYDSLDEKKRATNEVFMTTKDLVRCVGLPPKVIEVCDSVMENITTEVMKGKDKLSVYLNGMKNKMDLNFQFRFVELTSYIGTQIIEQSNHKDKAEMVRALIFASFFCDVSLEDASHLSHRTEASLTDVWPQEKESIMNHAFKASEIIKRHKNVPSFASEIILQHHGDKNGKGFPGSASSDLHPLALCLFAAQEIAHALLHNSEAAPEDVIAQVVAKNASGNLGPYLLCFQRKAAA